jgi:ribosomal subunit interface protein
MDVRVAGKQIDIGQALPEYVRKELPAAIRKHFDQGAEANVVFVKERNSFRADCTVHLSSGTTFQAHGAAQDAYRAFGQALEHLEKRVRRYMGRLKNHHSRGQA